MDLAAVFETAMIVNALAIVAIIGVSGGLTQVVWRVFRPLKLETLGRVEPEVAMEVSGGDVPPMAA